MQVLNDGQIKKIDRHPAKDDEDRSPESISDTKNWLNWNWDLDNPNDCEDDWEAEDDSDMQLDNSSEDSETPVQQNASAAPNLPGLFRSTQRSRKKVEKALMTVNIIKTRWNKGIKNK